MSDSILYTLITIGIFVAFYLFIILPLRLRARRKGFCQEHANLPKSKDWMRDPTDPLFRSVRDDALKEW